MTALIKAVRGNTLPVYLGVDCTGKPFGDWTVLGPMTCSQAVGSKKYITKWLCQCACGSAPAWVIKQNLTRGLSKGCYGCYGTRNSRSDNGNWKGHGEVPGEAFNKVRFGAKSRGIPLEVTTSDLHDLWMAQDRRCALTGMALVMGETASLDRIDSNGGYCLGNIQWVHKVINIMKNDFTEEVFFEMCRRVTEQRSSAVPPIY
jgi:hypothetical protein